MPDYWQFLDGLHGPGPIQAIYQAHVMEVPAEPWPGRSRRPQCLVFHGATVSAMNPNPSAPSRWQAGRSWATCILSSTVTCSAWTDPVRGNGKIIQELEGSFAAPAGT